MPITVQQLTDDRAFVRGLIDGNLQVVDQNAPERKREMLNVLGRVSDTGRRRGGPTRELLLQLRDLIPGDFNIPPASTKGEIVAELSRLLNDGQEDQQPEGDGQDVDNAGGPPAGGPPPDWGRFGQDGQPPNRTVNGKPLLRLKRGEMNHLFKQDRLKLLLQEQTEYLYLGLKQRNDYALVEMTGNPTPLPQNTSQEWVYYIYEKTMEQEIDQFKNLFETDTTQDTGGTKDTPVEVSASSSSSSSSSDSDLESYFPKKRFAIPDALKRTRKRKRKRKKKKKKKRKRKRRSHSSSSSTDSSSSSSSDEEQPNGRRVRVAAYGPNHYEQLQEFREEYREYQRDAKHGDWPEGSALRFIATKFARPGSKFAHKTKGVKARFKNMQEQNHARKRTAQIYDMADTVAELRLERNQMLSRAARKAEGASRAKAM